MQDRIGEGEGGHGCSTQEKQQNSRNWQGLTKKHTNQILLMIFKGKGWRLRMTIKNSLHFTVKWGKNGRDTEKSDIVQAHSDDK